MKGFMEWTVRFITCPVLVLCFGLATAQAAEDWNKRMVWWDWHPDGNGLDMCPVGGSDPCVEFRKIAGAEICRNISGDFENVAASMEAERNNSLTVKFFTCDANKPHVGVVCIDANEDRGFEACGFVGKSELASFASSKRKAFELNKRPKK